MTESGKNNVDDFQPETEPTQALVGTETIDALDDDYDPTQDIELDATALGQLKREQQSKKEEQIQSAKERYALHHCDCGGLNAINPHNMDRFNNECGRKYVDSNHPSNVTQTIDNDHDEKRKDIDINQAMKAVSIRTDDTVNLTEVIKDKESIPQLSAQCKANDVTISDDTMPNIDPSDTAQAMDNETICSRNQLIEKSILSDKHGGSSVMLKKVNVFMCVYQK